MQASGFGCGEVRFFRSRSMERSLSSPTCGGTAGDAQRSAVCTASQQHLWKVYTPETSCCRMGADWAPTGRIMGPRVTARRPHIHVSYLPHRSARGGGGGGGGGRVGQREVRRSNKTLPVFCDPQTACQATVEGQRDGAQGAWGRRVGGGAGL